MHNLTFPMLGTISSVEITQDSPAEEALNKLRDAIADKLVKALQATSFIEKGIFIHAIEHCLNDARTLCNFPQLLGRPLVAIVPADASANQIIAPLADFEPAWNRQITLPRLLTQAAGESGIEVISATGKPVNLKDLPGHNSLTPYRLEGEELEVLLNLPEDGIDPRSLCRGLHCQLNLKPSNMAFLILPPQEFGRADSGKLLAHCDAVIVLGKMANQKSLKVLRNNFNMPVYFLTNSNVDDEIRYLQSRYAGREIVHKSPGDFWQLLQTLDTPTQRITLKDRLLAEILAIEEDLANQIQGRKALMNKLQRDNTLFAGDRIGLGEILEAMRKSIHQDIQNLNKQKADFSRAAEEVLDAAKAVEKLIQEGQAHKEHNSHAKLSSGVMRPGSLWRRIILRSLVAGYPMQAAGYQDKFEGMYPKDAFLTRMYLENQKGHKPGKQEIEQLRHLPDSPEALRAKIFFRNELGLSEDDCINIAAILPRPKSADECYFWALHNYAKYQDAKKTVDRSAPTFDDVLQTFRDAVLAGSSEAADMFAKYCGGESRHEETLQLANMGFSTAAWIYRLLSLTRKDGPAARKYLKIAAALGYPKAVTTVAENIWKNRVDGDDPGFDFKSGRLQGLDKKMVSSGVGIYEALRKSSDASVPDSNERLGYFYFCNGQWRQSREALGNYPTTTEGAFCRAIMLRYGHGGNQDRKEAIQQIRRAEEGTGPFANFAKFVKSQWFSEDKEKI